MFYGFLDLWLRNWSIVDIGLVAESILTNWRRKFYFVNSSSKWGALDQTCPNVIENH